MVDEGNSDGQRKSGLKGPGCISYCVMVGVILLGGGVYQMGRWDALPGMGKVGAVMMVVIGTLALLPPLIVLGFGIVLKVLMRKIGKGLSGAAQEMIAANKQMYGTLHEFRPATDEDFDGLNRTYYDETTAMLGSIGYRHLGDLVDATIEENNDVTTPIRVLASADGTTQVGIYHFKLPNMPARFAGKEMLICDVSTEFSDGTFLMTSNTKESDLTTTPPRIEKRKCELGTPVEEMVRGHEAEKQKLLAAKSPGGVTCVAVNTIDEAIASEKRQQEAKNEFRKGIGYIDPEEVKRIGDGVVEDPEILEMTAKAVDEERKKEQDG